MKTRRPVMILAGVLCIACTSFVQGQQQTNSTSQSAALRAIQPNTTVLMKIDTKRVAVPTWIENGHTSTVAARYVDLFKKASAESDVIATLDVPYGVSQPAARLLVAATDAKQIKIATTEFARLSVNPIVRDGFVIVADQESGSATGIDESVLPVDRRRFVEAEKTVEKFPIRILFVPPAHIAETYEELMPMLPASLGGGPTKVVTRGVQWAAIGIDLQDMSLSAVIDSESDEAAKAFAKRMPSLIDDLLGQLPDHYQAATALREVMRLAKLELVGKQIHMSLDQSGKPAVKQLLGALLSRSGSPITSNRKRNQMRQIVLGVLNYESAHAAFPPADQFRNKDGKSGLSWRVHILPYLDEIELYSQFHLDESWDSAHNIKLLERMPDIYSAHLRSGLSDPVVKPGHTTFLAPSGDGTILQQREQATKIRHIVDGTSKTALIVEVAAKHSVPWTAPMDYNYSADDPGAGLAWDQWDEPNSVGVAFCDGHWLRIRKETPPAELRKLFQMNDGQTVNLK